jgi:threonine dehydratase
LNSRQGAHRAEKKHTPSLEGIINARKLFDAEIRKTPLMSSHTLSEKIGSHVFLKMESLQKTGSFKVRGAWSKLNSLSAEERRKGVITASAGNHAQGVAFSAMRKNIPCKIIMPKSASPAKVAATRSYGAEVILSGSTYDETWKIADSISKDYGNVMIHAFDDPLVICGQGTIGLELMEDLQQFDKVYVPIGGGGLASGISIALKAKRPNVKIIGVESNQYPAMKESVRSGHIVTAPGGFSIADGISVKSPGELTFRLCSEYVDDIVTVDDISIVETMFLLMEREKVVVEPAGAASLAYLLSHHDLKRDERAISILSGGNVDMYLLGQIVAKGLMQMGRMLRLFIQLPDKPGALKTVVDRIADLSVNIVEVNHDRLSANIAAGSAGVYLSLELEDEKHAKKLMSFLTKEGIEFRLSS